MHKKTVAILLGVAAAMLSGCGTLGNFSSIHRDFDITKGMSQLIDVKQREILIAKTGKGPAGVIVCAEPSPDALAAYGASLAAQGSSGGVSGGVSAAAQEQAISLAQRTAAIQLLRDTYYRLCESYLSGEIHKWTYDVMLRRTATDAIAYLAIDQLTAALGQTQAKATGSGGKAPSPKPLAGPKTTTTTTTTPDAPPSASGSPAPSKFESTQNQPTVVPISYSDNLIPIAAVNPPASTHGGHSSSGGGGGHSSGGGGNGSDPCKNSTPKKPNPACTGNDTAPEKVAANPVAAVAKEVRHIVDSIVNDDYSLTMCFSYYTDGEDENSNADGQAGKKEVSAFCDNVINGAAAEKSFPPVLLKAYATNCLDPETYKDRVLYCKDLRSILPGDAITKGTRDTTDEQKSANGKPDNGNETSNTAPDEADAPAPEPQPASGGL